MIESKGFHNAEGFGRHHLITAVTAVTSYDPDGDTMAAKLMFGFVGGPGRPIVTGIGGSTNPNVFITVEEDASGEFATVRKSYPDRRYDPDVDHEGAQKLADATIGNPDKTVSSRIAHESVVVTGFARTETDNINMITVTITHADASRVTR